jgi:hypothetical protein
MDVPRLLQQWLNGITMFHIAHHRAAALYEMRGRLLGLPVTIFSVVIGTTIFSTLGSSQNQGILLFVGVISMITAVLSGLQTFLNYPELAEKHRAASVKYAQLRRRVEEVIAFTRTPEELENMIGAIRNDWNKVEEESPEIPQRLHDMALKFVKPDIAEKRRSK